MANNIKKDEPDSLSGLFGAALRGLAAGLVCVIALALILSAAALALEDPMRLLEAFALAALFIGAFVDGFTAARALREGGIVVGLTGGALYVLVIWLVSLFFRGGENAAAVSPLWLALGYLGCVAIALLGCIAGRPRAKRVREGSKSPAALARRHLKSVKR